MMIAELSFSSDDGPYVTSHLCLIVDCRYVLHNYVLLWM